MKMMSPLTHRGRAWFEAGRAYVSRQLIAAVHWSRRYRRLLIRAALTGAMLALSAALSLFLWRRSPHFRATLRTLPALTLRRSRAILTDLQATPRPARRVVSAGVEPLPAEEIPAPPLPNGHL